MKTYKNPLYVEHLPELQSKISLNPFHFSNEKFKQCVITGGEMLYNSDEIVKNSSRKLTRMSISASSKC